MSDYLGSGHRLDSGPTKELATTAFAHELDAVGYLWRGMSCADLAHAIALDAAGVLPAPVAPALFRALLDLDARDPATLDFDPATGDIYNNRTRLLEDLAPHAIGHLHAGRARREASTIGWLLSCRSLLIDLHDAVADLVVTFAETARLHTTTLMPDFTYLHRAHPTSLAHYLLAHAWPVARHLDRLSTVLTTVNASSPAGSGSVNGTRIPLDRRLLASLLGFDEVMWHTRDAMWAPDIVLDLSGVAIHVMTSVDRLAEELQLWTTESFAFLSLADGHSRASVVMPHKKNPYALTHLRGAARRMVGTSVGVTASLLTASGQPDNRTTAYGDVPAMLETATESVQLMSAVIHGATFHVDELSAAASDPFMASTDVCDLLTLRYGVDNTSAHKIVGTTVRQALESGQRTISASALRTAALEQGIDVTVDSEQLAATIDPTRIVESRSTLGGAAPASTEEMCLTLIDKAHEASSALKQHPARTFASHLVDVARDRAGTTTSTGE